MLFAVLLLTTTITMDGGGYRGPWATSYVDSDRGGHQFFDGIAQEAKKDKPREPVKPARFVVERNGEQNVKGEIKSLAITPDGKVVGFLKFEGDIFMTSVKASTFDSIGLMASMLKINIGRGYDVISMGKIDDRKYLVVAGGIWSSLYANEILKDNSGGWGWLTPFGLFQYFINNKYAPEVTALAISPHANYIGVGYSDNTIMIYQRIPSPNSGDTLILKSSFKMSGPVSLIRFLSDDIHFYAMDQDGRVMVFDINEGPLNPDPILEGIQDLEVISKGHYYLVLGDTLSRLSIFDLTDMKWVLITKPLFDYPGPHEIDIAFSGDTTVMGVMDKSTGSIRFFSINLPDSSPREIAQYRSENSEALLYYDLSISSASDDGKYLVFFYSKTPSEDPHEGIESSTIYELVLEPEYKSPEIAVDNQLDPREYLRNKRFHYIVMGTNTNSISNGYPPLNFAEKDAISLSMLLNELAPNSYAEFYPYALVGPDFISDSAKALMHRVLSNADTNDVILLYFATHGYLDIARMENYLLCYNTLWEDSLYWDEMQQREILTVKDTTVRTAISYHWLANEIEKSNAGLILIVVDACYAGTEDNTEPLVTAAFRGGSLMFKKIAAQKPNSRIFLFSSFKNEPSVEDAELGHGVFTYFLIQGLRGYADYNNDNVLTIKELWKYVLNEVNNYLDEKFVTPYRVPQHPFSLGNVNSNQPIFLIVR